MELDLRTIAVLSTVLSVLTFIFKRSLLVDIQRYQLRKDLLNLKR